MNTGQWIVFYIIAQIFVIAVWDIWAFKKDKMTASRYIIRQAKRYYLVARLVFLFTIAIIILGVWLFFHWEINCIVFNFLCGFDI